MYSALTVPGYTTFVGLGFETRTSAIEPVFDLSWDNSLGNPNTGAALQANMFYNVRFQGGDEGLSIGRGGYMGSENLIVEGTFKQSNAGMAVHNYNALANVAVASVFENVKIAVEQDNAGGFNVYNSTMKNIGEAGVTLKNSASEAFVLDHIDYQEPVNPFIMQGSMTSAPINILVNGSTLAPSPNAAQPSIAMKYNAGGSVVFLNSALGGRVINSSGSIGEKTLILDTRSKNTSSHSVGGNAKVYFVSPLTFTIGGSPGAGAISREVWTGISGTFVADIPLGAAPNTTDTLPSFEAPTDWADNYGTRLRGYITAPVTGSYTFWIASDDKSELWLSTDDNPLNKVKIAFVADWTTSHEWNKLSSQKSAAIHLDANQRYYVEALQKEAGGGDNLAVGWARPGQATSAPSEVIPGSVLSPFSVTSGSIIREVWTGISGISVANIPVGATPPNTTDTLPSFEAPTNWADNYGTRLRGYITAPVTGSYTFWIASDDNSELWLSTDDNPLNKVEIASVPDWTDSREWNKFSSQKSAPPHPFDGRSALLSGGVAKGSRRWRQPCGGVGQAGPIDLRAERGDSRFGRDLGIHQP